ncbi:MAG TPA: glycosyltransferase family 1 protein, partial [Thermoanaerobaculia bacterium]|nr:glycosyltransferase family 1 protein [Thermoanaerobaculia bacterium]
FRRRLPPEELERWRRDLGLERSYLLFMSNPRATQSSRKNLDTVIRAYARARQLAAFDAPLVCVGERGSSEFKVRQRAAQLGVADHVRLLGFVAQEALPALYQNATLFLYPTLYEGFGLPVVEAMASGVAVITSNTSALNEIAKDYAHTVDPLDVEGMAQAIAHCMADPEHRNGLAKLGLRRSEAYRWSRAARKTLDTYVSAIQSRRAGPHPNAAAAGLDGTGAADLTMHGEGRQP